MWFGGLQRPEETESDFPEVVAAEINKSGKRAKFLREYFFRRSHFLRTW